MSEIEEGIFYNLQSLLDKDYRGVNIAVYALATASLAFSIHKIRPVSKFSKASKVPDHFIRNHEPLKGVYAGVQHSPMRLLINHKAPIYLPLWHSSKPPLPVKVVYKHTDNISKLLLVGMSLLPETVQVSTTAVPISADKYLCDKCSGLKGVVAGEITGLWGVDIVSGNAVNWLECVAKGQKVTLKPIGRDKEDLVSTVLLHLSQPGSKSVDTLDVGQKLVELGFAQASVPQRISKKTLESQLAPAILSAEYSAKQKRNGVWLDKLPPIPLYVVYWRKGSNIAINILTLSAKKFVQFTTLVLKSVLIITKNLVLRPFRSRPKQIQGT